MVNVVFRTILGGIIISAFDFLFVWILLITSSNLPGSWLAVLPGILVGVLLGVLYARSYYGDVKKIWEGLGFALPKTQEEKTKYKGSMNLFSHISQRKKYWGPIFGLILLAISLGWFSPFIKSLDYVRMFFVGLLVTPLAVWLTSLLYFPLWRFNEDKNLRSRSANPEIR